MIEAKRVAFTAAGQVALESVVLRDLAAGEVLLETTFSVVSPGTERANLLAEANTETELNGFPFFPGYSNVGRVVQVGAGVKQVEVGNFVATMAGHQSHVIAVAPLRSPAQRVIATNATDLSWRLPADLEPRRQKEYAPFIILTIGQYGVRLAKVALGSQVIVFGLGPVGLSAGLLARVAGGLPVIGIAKTPELRQRATTLGFDHVFENAEDLQSSLPAFADAADSVIVEATGRPDSVLSALETCPKGSRLVLLGCTRGLVSDVNFYSQIHRKAVTVMGAHQPTRRTPDPLHSLWLQYWDADTTLRMIDSGRLDTAPFFSEEVPIEDLERAYDLVQNSRTALCVALRWT